VVIVKVPILMEPHLQVRGRSEVLNQVRRDASLVAVGLVVKVQRVRLRV